VVVEGSYAYVDGCANLVLDISDPALPTLVSSSDAVAGSVGFVMNGYAYAMGPASLHIIDISNLAKPKEVGLYQVLGWPRDIAVAGNYAYVADPNNGLRVLDISDPAAPSEVGNLPAPGYLESLAVQGDYVYAGGSGVALQVIDVSDPARPVQVGAREPVRNNNLVEVWSMDVAGDYAYVVDSEGNTFKLWVVDVSDPTDPVELGFHSLLSGYDIAVVDNHAYVVDGTGLQVVDVSEPTAPALVGSYAADGIFSVAVADNYAYLGAIHPNDLRVIDISNPAAPVEAGFYTPPTDAREVAVAGSFAYVLDEYSSGLRVVDISDPTTPILVDFYELPNPTQFDGMTLANGYVYAGAGAAGLYILRHASTVE
jgi:hypothetical protein